jgi:cysteine desulfurase
MQRIYLDHQSTTPLHAQALEAMQPFLKDVVGVPAAFHQAGLETRDAMEQARNEVASLIHAPSPESILFTSGGTESVNLAIKGAAWANRKRGRHIVLTEIEHPALGSAVKFLEEQGFTSTRVGVDHEGRVDPEAVREAITDETILLCVHHTNHDIGTVQPVEALGILAAEHGLRLFVDATASGGWLPLDVESLNASLVALSPHRFFGPSGVGILYRHRHTPLSPLLHGGQQEHGLRAGTENVAAIVGAGVAARLAHESVTARAKTTRRYQQQLWKGLQSRVGPLRLNGPELGDHRHPSNLNVSIEFIEGEGLVLALDFKGVAFHSGPACLTGSFQSSPVLDAIGLSPALAKSGILLSPGPDNTVEEIDSALDRIVAGVEKLRSMSPFWEAFQSGRVPSEIMPDSGDAV